MHSIGISEMKYYEDNEFYALKDNNNLIIINLIKNNLGVPVSSENIMELINERNRGLVEKNNNFNI